MRQIRASTVLLHLWLLALPAMTVAGCGIDCFDCGGAASTAIVFGTITDSAGTPLFEVGFTVEAYSDSTNRVMAQTGRRDSSDISGHYRLLVSTSPFFGGDFTADSLVIRTNGRLHDTSYPRVEKNIRYPLKFRRGGGGQLRVDFVVPVDPRLKR